jgi:hydrogenase expression/formation protein HypD
MKYIDEFRNPDAVRRLLGWIRDRSTRPVRLMEFCGGHTHAVLKYGLRQLLPPAVRLLSGPGCPVCVTASSDVDRAIALAHLPGVVMSTFGDMMRVPGSSVGKASGRSLQDAKAQGADVRMVYSTLDALSISRGNPDREVIFLAIGFETTAPTVAAAVLQAQAEGLENFSVLSLHKLTPPATKAILDAGEVQLSGIIGPGHVTTIIGSNAWEFLPHDYGISCSIAGFEPVDILQAIYFLVDSIEKNTPAVRNAYRRSVQAKGNRVAQRMMRKVFEVKAAEWRGLGNVPSSGLALRKEYATFDASRRFAVEVGPSAEPKGCRCGEVLRGVTEPFECPLFARVCSPEHPIGPCMVSSEGACAAHMQYGEA